MVSTANTSARCGSLHNTRTGGRHSEPQSIISTAEARIAWVSIARCRSTDPDEMFVSGAAQRKAAVFAGTVLSWPSAPPRHSTTGWSSVSGAV